jgi:hypothetical protein
VLRASFALRPLFALRAQFMVAIGFTLNAAINTSEA